MTNIKKKRPPCPAEPAQPWPHNPLRPITHLSLSHPHTHALTHTTHETPLTPRSRGMDSVGGMTPGRVMDRHEVLRYHA
jgi:hypothetical protein